MLAGGDDHALAFTAPKSAHEAVRAAARQADKLVTRIGQIDTEAGLRMVDAQGLRLTGQFSSFSQFIPL